MVDLERRLSDYGAEIRASDSPISFSEVALHAGSETGPTPPEADLVEPTVRQPFRGWAPWKVAAAACLLALLVFVPLFFLGAPEQPPVTDDTLPAPSFPTTTAGPDVEEPVPYLSSAYFGPIDWFSTRSFPIGASVFALDGRYYGYQPGAEKPWWSSADGILWSTLDEAPAEAPPVPELGELVVFESEVYTGQTLAAISNGVSTFELMQRVEDGWVDVSFELPHPREGVRFVTLGDSASPKGVSFARPFVSRRTTVVIRDGMPMTMPDVGRVDKGIVSLGQAFYAVSTEGKPRELSGFQLWRSEDGTEWSEVEIPVPLQPAELAWVYLTAGHNRLMLTIGKREEGSLYQSIWTSEDGATWGRLDGPILVRPTVPEATDFGWMLLSLGHWPDSRSYNIGDLNLTISNAAATEWNQLPNIPPLYRFETSSPLPVTYESGLFVRNVGGDETYVGRFGN